jgi:hypothetical protein
MYQQTVTAITSKQPSATEIGRRLFPLNLSHCWIRTFDVDPRALLVAVVGRRGQVDVVSELVEIVDD